MILYPRGIKRQAGTTGSRLTRDHRTLAQLKIEFVREATP